MSTQYRHTQTGWVILLSTVPFGLALVAAGIALGQALVLAGVGLTLLATAALFSTLTVRVDDAAVEARFGPGLIKKRVALAEVRAAEPVTNPWYYGWGIHLYPGGVLYNVSGSGAVELRLRDGGRCRIGTDEPDALVRAIVAATGPLAPLSGEELARDSSRTRRWGVALAAAVGVFVVAVGGLLVAQRRPPVFTVDASGLTVDTPFYGQRIAASDIRQVSLEPTLPHVSMRTNGFAMGGALRGWFRVDGLGEGKLFVEADRAPFVLVRHASGFTIISTPDASETRALFDRVQALAPQTR